MYILAIETTGPFASAAITDDAENVNWRQTTERMNHLSGLIGLASEVMAERGISSANLSAIAVSEGPGSFTGIRIGVSTARALSQVWGIPMLGIPTLDALALNAPPEFTGFVCPLLDARRSQVYAGIFRKNETILPGAPIALNDLLAALDAALSSVSVTDSAEVMFCGDGTAAYDNDLKLWFATNAPKGINATTLPPAAMHQRADSVAKLALAKWRKGEIVPPANLRPNYMRAPEAERVRNR